MKDMAAKEVACRKQIDDIVSALLVAEERVDTPENRVTARESLVEQCKQLTEKETSPNAGQPASSASELAAMYALSRLKLELTDDPRFRDDRRSFNFLIGAKGGSAAAINQLKTFVAALEETDNGRPLTTAGWLGAGSIRKPWGELVKLEDFSSMLDAAKGYEVLILQERVASKVLEFNTAGLLITCRSHTEKARKKNQRASARLRVAIGDLLYSLATWAVWTPRDGIPALPAQPSEEVVSAALRNEFPWAAAGGTGGVPGLLSSFRTNDAKLK